MTKGVEKWGEMGLTRGGIAGPAQLLNCLPRSKKKRMSMKKKGTVRATVNSVAGGSRGGICQREKAPFLKDRSAAKTEPTRGGAVGGERESKSLQTKQALTQAKYGRGT